MPLSVRDGYTQCTSSSSRSPSPPPSPSSSLLLTSKHFDPVTFDVLLVSPDHFASQLTLIDLPIFQAIKPDELSSCGWSSRAKCTVSPNVVAFSRRFNHVCLWCQREIVQVQNRRRRADVLTHFIKIAKRLLDLSNLHSAFALISALQSSSIYRLQQTWATVSSKEKTAFDKMARLFADDNNWARLRHYTAALKLPCIPYLGLYLTDLTYIDVMHPSSGIERGQRRDTLMNNILRVLANFQDSKYEHLLPIDCIQQYLHSVKFIDELQKFVEDNLFKLSLSLESDGGHEVAKRRDTLPFYTSLKVPLTARASSDSKSHSLTPHIIGSFRPHHRKTQSLDAHGTYRCKLNESFLSNETFPQPFDTQRRHLLDDSLLDFSSCEVSSLSSSQVEDSGHETCDERVEFHFSAVDSPAKQKQASERDAPTTSASHEGPVRRKTLLKDGARPTMMHSWSRYWLTLTDGQLTFYAVKPLSSRQLESRSSYRSEPCKKQSVHGWKVFLSCDPLATDCFQLQEPARGNIYKFRASNASAAVEWTNQLKLATSRHRPQLPTNLMSFD